MRPSPLLDRVRSLSRSPSAPPGVVTAARALGARLGLTPSGSLAPDTLALGVPGGLEGRGPAPDTPGGWVWIRIDPEGAGELSASHPSFLVAVVELLADGALDDRADEVERGLQLPVSFPFHRTLYDHCLTQVSRTARGFEAEPYVAALARAGFTHLEVNALQAHVPFEPGVPSEYYNQFYTYCAGLNHFVDSPLTRGVYPAEYLQANLRRLVGLAELGRSYGMTPGIVCFEPRSLPETFFQRYPTLRGARIDHPFRSHLPRYTLAQDHPVAQAHYADMMRAVMDAVPDLGYLSVWSNDSGAGFEHTSSLYVGRNGGPYMIREWRDHDQIAETAGRGVLRWMRLMQEAGAETNPDFEVLLRVEPFKVEHDTLLAGMGDGIGIEAPSLLVRGYELPYAHPNYPEQTSAAATIFHTHLEDEEATLVAAHRADGFEPKLSYAASTAYNMEPLLGIPFPRMLHRKLTAMRESGFQAVSAWGGLLHTDATPYWPHLDVIRAAQFLPDHPIDRTLLDSAVRFVGEADAPDLVAAWDVVEDAVSYVPIVPLYSHFGFVWLRTWVRPLVPDIEAIPVEDRLYYERFLVSTANNPNINDLGRDVLFTLITQESGAHTAEQFDRNALPRIDDALGRVGDLERSATDDAVRAVYRDLLDRTRALRCWATTQRNTCAWVGDVYGALGADTEDDRERHVEALQATIDLDLDNTRALLDLWETSSTETVLVSDVGETSFIYGDNLGALLRRKIELTEAYRDRAPRIDPDILWRLP